ncbi:hypothetical protein [Nostoc sp.]|uniref:hypothetical protein n=1 Tax=Nostoc sp. TaxID=1180 RepID=UPI002FFB9C54
MTSNPRYFSLWSVLYQRLRRACFSVGVRKQRVNQFWILDFGFWILDFGFWILDFGFWILDFGFWIDPDHKGMGQAE